MSGRRRAVIGTHLGCCACAATGSRRDPATRVHPISPDPLETRAASGLKDFELLLNEAVSRAPVDRRGD